MPAKLSVIIPSWRGIGGERGASVAALQRALASQTLPPDEVLVIEGVSPQGKAINRGVERSRGDVVVIVDDDSSIHDRELMEKLARTLAADATIGMAGASVRTPPDANWLQRRAAREFPRFQVPVVAAVTDSDLPCHGCAAFPRAALLRVGGEREDLVRGLDPDLRQRLRRAGYRVVLAPHAVVHHPLPPTLAKLLATFARNGRGSAFAQRVDPDSVFETSDALGLEGFVPHRPLAYRILRFPLRILWAALTLRWIRALAYTAYAWGYLRALAGPGKP